MNAGVSFAAVSGASCLCRDSRQVSYIEAIGASSEIENLRPVPDNKKTAVECSTADKNGGAYLSAAVSGASCLWFISSEGVSVLENASLIGVPIPKG